MIGNPKFKVGDFVKVKIENTEYKGQIYIVNTYGTFENSSDVSYDIMVENWGPKKEQCFFKHITEKLVGGVIMTRAEERNKAVFEAYPENINYSMVIEQTMRRCWLAGAEWADETMIEKVCKFINQLCDGFSIKDNIIGLSYTKEELLKDIRKVMKE